MLIQNNGKAHIVLPHDFHHIVKLHCFGNLGYGMNVFRSQSLSAEHDTEQIAGMHHAHHMVQITAVDRVTRTASATHNFPYLLMFRPFWNGVYPDARGHDLVYIQIIQVKQAVHDAAGFLRQRPVLMALFNNILEFFRRMVVGLGFITVHTQQPQKEIAQGIHTHYQPLQT